jgi:hypothetical protein
VMPRCRAPPPTSPLNRRTGRGACRRGQDVSRLQVSNGVGGAAGWPRCSAGLAAASPHLDVQARANRRASGNVLAYGRTQR